MANACGVIEFRIFMQEATIIHFNREAVRRDFGEQEGFHLKTANSSGV